MNEKEYIVRETNYPLATKQEVIGELVRCKDCAKVQHDTIFGRWYCKGKRIEPTDYCSYGERKKAESE